MEKTKQLEVSNYQFQDLKGVPLNASTENYEFEEIGKLSPKLKDEHDKVIKIERDHAKKTNFKVAPIVREHRGMIQQEQTEKEIFIKNEVDRRLMLIEEEAYKKGFEKGQNDGREEVYRETQASTDEKLQALGEMISEVLNIKADMLKEERLQVYETVKTLTKWIVLKELKDDGTYIERLLEKLILEMQNKSNLLIHVNASSFESMPEVLERIENRLGELTNVRVEVEHGFDLPGIVLQSENGILNGNLGVQFKNLDKIFSNVGLPFTDSSALDILPSEEEKAVDESIDEVNSEIEELADPSDEEPNE